MNEISDNSAISELNPAAVIAQALPYMQRYTGKIIVVKLGGNAMIDEALGRAFARDVVLLRQSGALPVIVHGGGPQIGSMLKQLGIKSEFRRGLRVTDKKTMEIVEMVLAGSINKEIVRQINNEGGRAVGICGKDGKLVTAGHVNAHAGDQNASEALGYVGIPQECDPEIIVKMIGQQLIPVVAPVASGDDGATYNINADTFAGALAGALGAARLLLLTDVPGVLDRQGNLLTELRCADIEAKIKDGTIHGGMIPKIETCTKALALGVGSAVILDGRAPHSVLLELLTNQGKGTMIQP